MNALDSTFGSMRNRLIYASRFDRFQPDIDVFSQKISGLRRDGVPAASQLASKLFDRVGFVENNSPMIVKARCGQAK